MKIIYSVNTDSSFLLLLNNEVLQMFECLLPCETLKSVMHYQKNLMYVLNVQVQEICLTNDLSFDKFRFFRA